MSSQGSGQGQTFGDLGDDGVFKSLGSKSGMKVGGVKAIGPNIVESTIGIL